MPSDAEVMLVDPSLEWLDELRRYIEAFRAEGRTHIPGLLPDDRLNDPQTLICKLRDFSRSVGLPPGWVPSTTWFGVQGRVLVGNINLRHQLTPGLEIFGGHVGYAVHPQHRNKGHASRMLQLLLPKASGFGLQRLLFTCDDSNSPSARVIEKNGGVLQDKLPREGGGLTRRYWIELKNDIDTGK
jgi:predicted acetyltransferase